MTLDIHRNTISQDPKSKQIKSTWTLAQARVPVYANSVQTHAVSDASSGKRFQSDYTEFEFVKILTMVPMTKRDRVTNIRSDDGISLWTEEKTGIPTVFEVDGVLPIIDPFGTIQQYEVLAKRVEVQP
jgi:hypothetical protein